MESDASKRDVSPGDRVIVHGHRQGEHPRDGEILEVHGEGGAGPYLVRWEDGSVSELYPGSDVVIHRFEHGE